MLISITTIATEMYVHHEGLRVALEHSIAIFAGYLGSLFGSILIYRIYLHRLRSFPGPFLAAASKLWHSWKVRDSTNHILMKQLHEKYGTFVRTGKDFLQPETVDLLTFLTKLLGPAEVTIFSAEALYTIDCPGSQCTKPDWYDNILPMKSLINIRSPEDHDCRKRIWEPAFTPKGNHQVPHIFEIKSMSDGVKL